MRKIVTIFPTLENIHLTKDVGEIPYFLYKKFGFESIIVTYKNGDYEYLDNAVKGVKLHFLKNRGRYLQFDVSVICYLLKNARHIPVLNLYHFTGSSYIYGILYKILNPKGILYLKSDLDYYYFKSNYPHIYIKSRFKNYLVHLLEKPFIRIVSLVSVENKAGYDLLNELFGLGNRLIMLPGGIDITSIQNIIPAPRKYSEKEDLIITAGRIGLAVKNHGMLLKLGGKIDLKRWKMIFIGPVDQNFISEKDTFFEKHPHLKERIIFTGSINSKKELYEWYDRSKIFCLTSHREGTPTVLAESLYFGLYFLTTDCSAGFQSLQKDEKLVDIVPVNDIETLKEKLCFIMEHENIIEDQYIRNINAVKGLFDWETNIDTLADALMHRLMH